MNFWFSLKSAETCIIGVIGDLNGLKLAFSQYFYTIEVELKLEMLKTLCTKAINANPKSSCVMNVLSSLSIIQGKYEFFFSFYKTKVALTPTL